MKIEVREVPPQPPPRKEVVLTLTEREAALVRGTLEVVGNPFDGWKNRVMLAKIKANMHRELSDIRRAGEFAEDED